MLLLLLTRNRRFLRSPLIAAAVSRSSNEADHLPLWTDDYTSLWPALKLE